MLEHCAAARGCHTATRKINTLLMFRFGWARCISVLCHRHHDFGRAEAKQVFPQNNSSPRFDCTTRVRADLLDKGIVDTFVSIGLLVLLVQLHGRQPADV